MDRLPLRLQYVEVEASVSQDTTTACNGALKCDEGKD
jgi:hypothetical protein